MYQNIYISRFNNKSTIHLWDDKLGYQSFDYKPYAYQKNPAGTYRSLYGDKLTKIKYWKEEDLHEGKIFESDLPIDTRVLVDRYYESDEMSEGHRELIIDIEVEVTDGFPEPS